MSPDPKSAACTAAELRTEYRVDPLGIETLAPRLSWTLAAAPEAPRGLQQVAYQIVVATGADRLTPTAADLWDPGEVRAGTTSDIAYAGTRLRSRQRCWWRVRVMAQDGVWSEWSAPATWTMGILEPSGWHGRWIGRGDAPEYPWPPHAATNTLPDAWLRRAFVLEAEPLRATAFVASVGFHELYVNGVKVGENVLAPHVTDNSKRARYVAYEIGPWLRAGQNVLGLWLGTGWSIFSKFATPDKPRAPIVLAEFDVDLPDGGHTRIVTDAAWKTHPSPSMLLGSWDFRDFGGEQYDANLEIAGWCEPGLDESAWRAAAVFNPALLVSAEGAEPNQLMTELRPIRIERLGDGYRFDFGRNFAGWVEVAVTGNPGDRIDLQHSERPDRPITHRLRSAYIVGPSGSGVFRHRFNYGVGRWLTVTGLRHPPRLEDVRGWLARPAFTPAAAFSCSSPLLNDIHRTALWTFENLTLGGYVVDCPHRERMGYGGDAYATTATGLSAFHLGAFYTKWSEDWRDVQGRTPTWGIGVAPGEAGADGHEEGNLPYTAPTYWGGGGPAWSGYCVQLPWEVYVRYGDKRILETNFGMIERWLRFLETKVEGDLLSRYGGLWDFLGDWLWPDSSDVNGDTRETLFFNNCYWIYNLQVASAIADVLGHTALRDQWAARAVEARAAVHRRFYNPSDGSYVNGFQAYLAIALLTGVPPVADRPAVWRRLEHEILVVRRGHIHAGITGGAMLFQLLMEAGRDDLIHAMVSRDDPPSWGAMLRAGATTFWEAWGTGADSHLHSSFLFVGAWFIHGVLGIQPDRRHPGFSRFVVRPGVTDRTDLNAATGHYDSVRGRIAVAWRRTAEGRFELDLEVPPNTHAEVHLPVSSGSAVHESGHELAGRPGIEAVRADGSRIVVAVASGHYHFACGGAGEGTVAELVPSWATRAAG